MKLKLTALFIFIVFLGGQASLQADDNIFPDANHPDAEGYRGIIWNSSLKDFKSNKKSSTSAAITPAENTAINNLLMNFHEPDSTYPVAKTDIEQIPDDKTYYVFYDGHFCLAAMPIALKNLKKVQTFLAASYTLKNLTAIILPKTGRPKMELDYQNYENPYTGDDHMERDLASRIYLVTLFTLGPSHSKTLTAILLTRISNDYFNSPHNAWTEYQTQHKTKP
jgi:hypothetical protein